jgi:hypothetical protein
VKQWTAPIGNCTQRIWPQGYAIPEWAEARKAAWMERGIFLSFAKRYREKFSYHVFARECNCKHWIQYEWDPVNALDEEALMCGLWRFVRL